MRHLLTFFQGVTAGALIAWVAVAPLFWILRDGLGPDAVDSEGATALGKFLFGWGVPALVLAGFLVLSVVAERLTPRGDDRRGG